jgi:2-C-methyl-D-erythritol 2,4-cyclodiphosphate synthase
MRIGQGFDVHRFGDGDHIVLGGVSIPHSHGLIAHSDGDVLLHALCDALLGAAALGDIGRHFPDTDAEFKNIDSRILLRDVYSKVQRSGFELVNADITVIAERPKISPHVDAMVKCIAEDLGCALTQVNIKATTTESLGFTGRREGIAVQAIVLLQDKKCPEQNNTRQQ